MAFSFYGRFSLRRLLRCLFNGGLKGAHRLGPHLIEVGAQARDAFRVELIEAASAGASIGHKAGPLENFEVLRDSGTRDGKLVRQLIDGERTGGKLLKNRHAGGIPEGVESGL
jgi:hypothetical protein